MESTPMETSFSEPSSKINEEEIIKNAIPWQMKENEQELWRFIAEAIWLQTPKLGEFIHHEIDNPKTCGFKIHSYYGHLEVEVITNESFFDSRNEWIKAPGEKVDSDDDPLQYKDPPGTFEGMRTDDGCDL